MKNRFQDWLGFGWRLVVIYGLINLARAYLWRAVADPPSTVVYVAVVVPIQLVLALLLARWVLRRKAVASARG